MANDIDAIMAMDPLELAKDDEAIAAVIQYIRKHRGNVEEGKTAGKDKVKLTGLMEKLSLVKTVAAPKPIPRTEEVLMTAVAFVDKTEEVPSPFLPGTKVQYAWDSTSLGLLKTCPRLYQYVMIEGWGSREESVHLRFGIEYHTALEEFDHRRAEGMDYDEALFEVVKQTMLRTHGWAPDPESRAGKYKNRLSLIRTIVNYLDDHRLDAVKTYVLSNGKPAVELSFRFELDFGPKAGEYDEPANADWEHQDCGQPYLLSGHLDRVVEFAGGLFAMDRKTSMTTLGSYYFDQYDVHNQMTLYSLAAKVILDAPIRGVIIDAAQVLIEGNEFKRGITYRTSDRLEEWVVDLHHWLRSAEGYAEAEYWPQNDTSCDKYGGCAFRTVCSKSPAVRGQFLKAQFTQKDPEDRWNPLKPR